MDSATQSHSDLVRMTLLCCIPHKDWNEDMDKLELPTAQVESFLELERPRDHGMAPASVKWETTD